MKNIYIEKKENTLGNLIYYVLNMTYQYSVIYKLSGN